MMTNKVTTLLSGFLMTVWLLSCGNSQVKESIEAIQQLEEIAEAADDMDLSGQMDEVQEEDDWVDENIATPFEALTEGLPICTYIGESGEAKALDRTGGEWSQEELDKFDQLTTKAGKAKLLAIFKKAFAHNVKRIGKLEEKVTEKSSSQVKEQLHFCQAQLPKAEAYIDEFELLTISNEAEKCTFVNYILNSEHLVDSPMMLLSTSRMLQGFIQLDELKLLKKE